MVFLIQFLDGVVPSVTQCSKQTPLQLLLHSFLSFFAFHRSWVTRASRTSAGAAVASGAGAAAGMAVAVAERVRAKIARMDWSCMMVMTVVMVIEWLEWISEVRGRNCRGCSLLMNLVCVDALVLWDLLVTVMSEGGYSVLFIYMSWGLDLLVFHAWSKRMSPKHCHPDLVCLDANAMDMQLAGLCKWKMLVLCNLLMHEGLSSGKSWNTPLIMFASEFRDGVDSLR